MKKLFLSTLLMALPLLASAYDVKIDGIYYNLNPEKNEAEVTSGTPQYSGSVTIPEKFTYEGVEYSVTSIRDYAFRNCSGLTSVTIPNSVTSIGKYAFENCRGLSTVTIPNSVTSILGYAFHNCSGMTSVTIPNSVTSIRGYAFDNCHSLSSVHITDLEAWCKISFYNNESNPLNYAHHLYLNGEVIKDLVIPNSVTTIGNYAFRECSSLPSVTICNSVTSIGDYAFYNCTGLTSVTIPNSVTNIGDGVFYYCTGLTSIIIPEGVNSIGSSAFYNCYRLETVYLPASITYIGSRVFAYGQGTGGTSPTIKCLPFLKDLYCAASTKPYTERTQSYYDDISGRHEYYDVYLFGAVESNQVTLHVPSKSISDYKVSPWNSCKSIVPMEHILKYYIDGEMYKCDTLLCFSEIVPTTVITEDGYTFSGWNGLPETMPDEDLTVTGYFTINKYRITYMVDGVEYKSSEIEFGSTITTEENPTKEGYTFSGWSEIPTTMPASDVTITGTFVPNKYKLTYLLDGVEYKSSEIEFGSTITPETPPTKEGYTFSGWSEIPETMPASDVTITGSFTINNYKLMYTLDGEEYKMAEVEYGTALTPEEAPTKEGYTFSGWSEIPSTMPANDVTVTGTFTANKYKLTYMVDGEEYKASEVDYGTAITAEAVPTKEGYTFSGWSEIPSTMPAEDVTVTGTFTVNKYTITYMVDDEILTTEEVAYGSTIAPPKSQKDGYDILWSFYPTTMPAYSITINGTYTTGINGLNVEESERQVFTPDGKRVETPKKGLNIIRMSDGTVKKVVVK